MEMCVNYVTDDTLYNLDKIDNFMIKNLEENKVTCTDALTDNTDKWLIVAPLLNNNTTAELDALIETNKDKPHPVLHLIFIELNDDQEIKHPVRADEVKEKAQSYDFDVETLSIASIETSLDLPLQVKNLLTLLDFLMKVRKA